MKPCAQPALCVYKKTPATLLSSGQGYRGYSAGQGETHRTTPDSLWLWTNSIIRLLTSLLQLTHPLRSAYTPFLFIHGVVESFRVSARFYFLH